MAKTIVLKVTGDDRVFMVDLDALSVEVVAGATIPAEAARTKGVDFVVAAEPRSAAASHPLFSVDTAVTGAGAVGYESGSQKLSGNTAALTPNAIRTIRCSSVCVVGPS